MRYEYCNQFNLSNELAQAISSIISKKEKDNYVCKIITFTTPEHRGTFFRSPLTNDEICRPGFSALNGAQIQTINEEYGYSSEGIIPLEENSFFVIMRSDDLKIFSELSLDDKNKMEAVLKAYSYICESYFGIFDSKRLIQSFPYLQDFFLYLDKWRAKTGRVTVDDDVLENGMRKVLVINKNNVRK